MRGGIILLIVGLLLGYLAVSSKFCCLSQLGNCVSSNDAEPCKCKGTETASAKLPTVQENLAELLKPLETGSFSFPYTV